MTTSPHHIILQNAGLIEVGNDIFAQGFLDVTNIGRLLVDDYQREVLHNIRRRGGMAGIGGALARGGQLPAIMLGMRGSDFTSRGESIILNDKCYVIDGLQRISGIKQFVEDHPDRAADLRIGAEVRFSTTKESEKDLFQSLNSFRTAMSPNVILRNMRDRNRAILTIYGLSMSDSSSPIYKRVQWNQRMARGELVTATTIINVARILHGRAYSSSGGASNVVNAATLEAMADQVGLNVFRNNLKTFFAFLDECFNISKVQYAKQATPIKGSFLAVMAQMLSDHEEFWDGSVLIIDAAQRRKFALFPIDDYEVSRLAGAGATARPILYEMLKAHMNKGRRSNNKMTVRAKTPMKPIRQKPAP